MRVFTFIIYLNQHIPDKYFRVVRGYGLFSNRLKGELLPRARMSLGKSGEKEEPLQESWRERIHEFTGKDSLICENCSIEMNLIFVLVLRSGATSLSSICGFLCYLVKTLKFRDGKI